MQLSHKRRAELLAGPYTRLLADHEESLVELYRVFAELIPSAKKFWGRMASEKESHRTMIQNIWEQFQNGKWRFHRPAFATAAIVDSCHHVRSKTDLVRRTGVTMREALRYALEIERGKIESEFLQIVALDTSETMEIMESMRGFTRAHVRHLENEAKRLKWLLGGAKKEKAGLKERHLTHNVIQDHVKVTQATMIGQLVSLEEAVSSLYSTFSQRLVDCSAYWAKIAAEEMQHAAMVRALFKVLDKGHVFFNVARFNSKELLSQIEWILDLEYEARHKFLSRYIAINTALRIEQSLAERAFYTTVKSDAPEFKFVAERMRAHSAEHLKHLEEECARTIDLGQAATLPATSLKKSESLTGLSYGYRG